MISNLKKLNVQLINDMKGKNATKYLEFKVSIITKKIFLFKLYLFKVKINNTKKLCFINKQIFNKE
jgi:hypothetical protein